jgi:hypothetical protein
MVPQKDNPIWRRLVLNSDSYAFNALATKLMMMRVKMIIQNENEDLEKNISLASEIAYNYFNKNKTVLMEDIKYLFSQEEGGL